VNSNNYIGYSLATISYTGTVQWQPDPEPFGDVISEQSVGPGHDPLIRYPGQWRVDPVPATTEPTFTTLYYNTHRWYNPSWGRYTQADPVGWSTERGHFHLLKPAREYDYPYAMDSPLAFVYPMGESSAVEVVLPLAPFCLADTPALGPADAIYLSVLGTAVLIDGLHWALGDGDECEGEDDDREEHCEELWSIDMATCRGFLKPGARDLGKFMACQSQVNVRYSECLRFGMPLSPLNPVPFGD
jgi:RHS repeat-associated protein